MKQLVILNKNLDIKQILPVDDIIPVQDIISPQKTTFEVPINKELVIGDLIILKNEELFEYFGIIQDLEVDKTTKIASYPLINITDSEYQLSSLNGDVYQWIVDTFTRNFVNTDDELLKLPFTFKNNTATTNLKLDLQDGNLFDALLTIFKKTGVYVRFSLAYEEGKAKNIVCNVEKADEDTKITIRYDNPIVFETPSIELSQVQDTNKVIFKPADSSTGTQIFTFYLLENNTVTTDANASGRINGVVQSIQTYTKDNNTEQALKQKAEEIMLGDTLNHQITLKVINNLSYNFQLYDKVEYIDERMQDGKNRVFETYVTRIENNNEIYKVLRLGVLRTTLTDKVKALEKAVASKSTSTSSGGTGGGSVSVDLSNYYNKTEVNMLLDDKAGKDDIPTDYLPDSTRYGANLDLSIDSNTYVVTAQLKDQNGNNLGTAKTIDLPLESVVVSGSYDSTNKRVILTLKDGSTIDFSVADLVSGLQSEITSTNKLSVNLISGLSTIATSGALKDATEDATHRTVTDDEKTAWNNKVDAVAGKGLSTNDFTTAEKEKLAGLENYDGTKVYYGTSSSDGNNNKFIVESPNFKLEQGARICVKFDAQKLYTGATYLNVNGTGEKLAVINNGGSNIPQLWWRSGDIVEFVYIGNYYFTTDRVASTTAYGYTRLTSSIIDSDEYALTTKAGLGLSNRIKDIESSYIKQAVVSDGFLILTDQDGRNTAFTGGSGSLSVKQLYTGGATYTSGTITLNDDLNNYKEMHIIQYYSPSEGKYLYTCHTVPVEFFKLMYSTNEFLCQAYGDNSQTRYVTYKYVDGTHIQLVYSNHNTYFFTVYGVK